MNSPLLDDEDRRWQARLRAADLSPSHTPDLWPAIAAQLEPHSQTQRTSSVPPAALAGITRHRRLRRRSLIQSMVAAACLVMLVVLALPLKTPVREGASLFAQAHPLDTLLLREAEGLQREYAAAFAQFEGAPMPAAFAPGLLALDREGQRIHAQLTLSSDQPRLLDELRRVHERRLQLLRRGLELTA